MPKNGQPYCLKQKLLVKKLLGQLKAGAGGGARDKKQHEIQIEKVIDYTKVHVCA